jgi:large subunit ribosomal protein L7/L12
MSKLQGIITEIKTLTIIELAELVDQLQKEFGVSASSMVGQVDSASSEAAPAVAAKTSFKVELIESGTEKTKVIKALRVVKKDLGLIEAKNATENLPYLIFSEANKEDSDNAKKTLEEAGAKVKIS